MSSMNAEPSPEYARHMQWSWQGAGHSYRFPDDRLGGMEMLLLDPTLPASPPTWQSRRFPRSDILFRAAVGKADESYLLVPTQWHEALAPLQVGSVVKWFANGAPMGGAFSDGDQDRHQLLGSQVVPAFSPSAEEWQQRAHFCSKGTVNTAAMQPLADYLDATFATPFPPFQGGATAATPGNAMPQAMPAWPPVANLGESPIDWRRQVLFVKAMEGKGPAYVVLRDTVLCDTATMWLFWTLTRGLAATGQASPDLRATVRPSTALPGNRFSGTGQWGVDLDYFVAEPQDTPRHTLRWGKRQDNPPPAFDEYQDLLHLQREGKGSYLVFLCPRRADQAAPTFEALAPGVVRVRGEWGEDIVFLGDDGLDYRRDGITIAAPAGLIRQTPSADLICLVAGGTCSTPRASRSAAPPASQPAAAP
jgi:hypothetical protein